MRQEKTRLRSFPAVMHPKPIFRCLPNLMLNRLVSLQGDGVHRVAGRIEARGENHPPARRPFGVDRRGDQRGSGSFCQQTREGRSRGKSAEERRPKTMVAGVLIAQNSNESAGTQQFNWLVKAFAPIE